MSDLILFDFRTFQQDVVVWIALHLELITFLFYQVATRNINFDLNQLFNFDSRHCLLLLYLKKNVSCKNIKIG